MKGFINAKTYIKGRGIVCTNIAINNGRIAEIGGSADTIEPLAQTGECLLVPGFIDEHIHGAGGADVMDGDENALAVISETVLKEGTTAFLATTMTQSDSNLKKALGAVAAYKKKTGAKILGVHLEGPFISSEYIGAQQPKFIKKPSVGYF
ncbi:MAG: amidohydrolase family protein, partial [Clostridia bacterium]|nr:amidohydrolase family protein [Clostridia bacterium]